MASSLTAALAAALARRVVLVDVLAALFGLGAWLGVNAMYTQLPILVEVLPESWNVSSYIVIVVQAANVGGVAYSVLQRHHGGGDRLERGAVYTLMAVACASLLLMAFFYQEVVVVAGSPHSVALLVLVFACALPACTSSVLFVPYMRRFPPTYLVSYMVGEGLSGLLPSALSLVQGVGGDAVCAVLPDGSRHPTTPPPIFTTRTYLVIAFLLQAASATAFALLDLLPACQRVREEVKQVEVKKAEAKQADTRQDAPLSTVTFAALLATEAVLMFFSNGLFPSVQTYSCEPYGTLAYHLAINLGAMANPLACYLLFFVAARRPGVIGALTAATLAVAVYIMAAAAMSPSPPLVGGRGGEALVVVVWVVFTGLVSYTKLAIAAACRRHRPDGLFWWGALTQLGSLLGAALAFGLLNYTAVFHAYQKPSPCETL